MQGTRTVCVGVPVWRGADHVPETLESVLRQRGVRLTVVVSVDGDDQGSATACRAFLADPRVSLLVQPRRLGWVGNSSSVLTAAAAQGADYVCLQPHDDLLDDNYLAVLLAAAEANREAAVVYSDIQSFGTHNNVIRQPTVAGSPFERQMDVMRHHYAAVSYRGLMRMSALRSILPMAGNPCEDFAADTVWLARQALVGDLVRVPHALYRKRYHPNNTHSQWVTWSSELRMTAWSRHCLDMLAEALKATSTASERRRLHKAARTRLLHPRNWTPYRSDLVAMPPLARAGMRSRFDAAAVSRADIGPPPETRFRAALRAVSALRRVVSGQKRSDDHGGERQ
jgi:glycosyltransferase involved in cell wall biosynthesis